MDTNNHTGYAQVVLERLPQPAGDPTHVRDYIVGDDVLGHVDASGAQADVVQSYIYDGHGSVRGVAALASDPTLARAQTYDYDAYGNLRTAAHDADGFHTPSESNMLGYSGEAITWLDDDSTSHVREGMQYLRARWYDPANGRFNRMDPYMGSMIDPRSLHRYNYAYADPIMLADPSGQMPFTMTGLLMSFTVMGMMGLITLSIIQGPTPSLRMIGKPQLPNAVPNGRVTCQYHFAEYEGGDWTADQWFDAVTSLTDLDGDLIRTKASGQRAVGQVIGFQLVGVDWAIILPLARALGEPEFHVRVVEFDRGARLMVAETLAGHPLDGWRAWQVTETSRRTILVETWAVDQVHDSPQDRFKFAVGGKQALYKTWEGMLLNLEDRSRARIVPDRSMEEGIMWDPIRPMYERMRAPGGR